MRKISLLTLLISLIVVSVIPAFADDEAWSCFWDFTEGTGNWEGTPGSIWSGSANLHDANYVSDVGWQDVPNVFGGQDGAYLWLPLATPAIITSFTYTYERSAPDLIQDVQVGVRKQIDNTFDFADVPDTTPTGSATWTGNVLANAILTNNLIAPGETITLKSVSISGEGDVPLELSGYGCDAALTRPYIAEEFHAWGIFNNDGTRLGGGNSQLVGETLYGDTEKSIFAISDSPGRRVSASSDGVVSLLRKATRNDCGILFGKAFATDCSLNVPSYVNGSGSDYLHGLTGVNPPSMEINAWRVEVDSGRFRLIYLVENADKYVAEGQSVTAGCWIGESMRMTTASLGISFSVGADGPDGSVGLERGYAEQGITIINVLENGERKDAVEFFTEQPALNAPCNLKEGFEGCMGDSGLNTPGGWVSIDSQWRETGGVTINPGGYIKQQMNLDPTREPGLKVGVRAVGGGTNIKLTLGTAVQTVPVSPNAGFSRVEIQPDEHTPDGNFYTVEVRNTGNASAEFNYVCVYFAKDAEGNPTEVPDGPPDSPNDNNSLCKFADYSFDAPSVNWTISGGETATGEIRVPADTTISQSINVAAGTYTLSIVASVWHYSAFVPDDTDTDTITFEYDFPVGGGYTTISSKTFGQYAEDNNSAVHSMSFVAGSDTSGTFTFRPVFSGTPSQVRGVIIRSICIGSPQTGPGGGDGGDWEGPFETSCKPISTPTGTSNVGSWARWFWAKLDGFFQCELMVILNSIFTTINRLSITIGWSIRWGHEVTRVGVAWFTRDFTYWLAGYLSNGGVGASVAVGDSVYGAASLADCFIYGPAGCAMLAGQATKAAVEEGKSLPDIFYEAIAPIRSLVELIEKLISGFFNFLFETVPRLARIAYNVIVAIFNNVSNFFDLMLGLFSAYNDAEPQPIAGIMQCAVNPKENPVCIALWTLEHTVFSKRGYLLIPFLIAYWTVLLVIWAVQKVSAKIRGAMGAV